MKTIILSFLLVFSISVTAQKMKLTSGNLDFLKGQKEIQLSLDYSNATFYKEKMSESSYVEKRTKEISADKGNEEAKKWNADWKHSKENTFREKFISSWEKNSTIKIASNAPYKLLVETVWIYPGWFGGVMSQPAKVSTILKFVDSKNESNVLAVISSENAPGDGNFIGVPNNNDRIAEGYAKTAKSLAKFVEKKL